MAAPRLPVDDPLGAADSEAFRKARQAFCESRANAGALCGMDGKDAMETERVVFSRTIRKVNRRGVAQPRSLVVTSLAVYNLKPKQLSRWQRRIGLHELEELVVSPPESKQWSLLLHMWAASEEYDYLLEFDNEADRKAATAAVSSAFRELVGRPMSELSLPVAELSKRRVLKTQARARAKSATAESHRVRESRASVVRTNVAARRSVSSSTGFLGVSGAGSARASATAAQLGGAASPGGASARSMASDLAAVSEGLLPEQGQDRLVACGCSRGLTGPSDRAAWDAASRELARTALSVVDAVAARARADDSRAMPMLKRAEDEHGRASELACARLVADTVLHPQASASLHSWLGSMQADAAQLFEAAAALSSRPFRPKVVAAAAGDGQSDGEADSDSVPDIDDGSTAAGGGDDDDDDDDGGGPPLAALTTYEDAGEMRGWWLRVLWDLHSRAADAGGGSSPAAAAASAAAGKGPGSSPTRYQDVAEAVGRFYEVVPALLASPFPAGPAFIVGLRAEIARRNGIGSKQDSKGFASRSAGAAPWSHASASVLEQAAASPWVSEALSDDVATAAVASTADRVTSTPGTRTGHGFVPLEESVYLALLEIMMGQLHRPGDGEQGAETFGQLVRQAPMISLIMRLAPSAPTWAVRLRVVKDINVLLVRKDDNFARVMAAGDWPAWLVPLLSVVPKRDEDRDPRVKEYSKFVMNLYAMLLYHVMARGGDDVEDTIGRLFAQMRRQSGAWSGDVVAVARSVLSNLLVKIGSGCKRWRKDLTQPQWGGLFAVARVIEDFCFYRPEEAEQSGDTLRVAAATAELAKLADRRNAREPQPPPAADVGADQAATSGGGDDDGDDDGPSGGDGNDGPVLEWRSHGVCAVSRSGGVVPGLVPLLPEFASPAAVVPLATSADGKVDRASPGLHLGEADGEPLDLKLAKRTLTLLTKLGLKAKGKGGAAAAASAGASAAEKQVRRHGAGLVEAFEGIVKFFESVEKQGPAAIRELPAFLEKRQREQSTGFLSRGAASRKQLAAQLDASMMRQQAQREVRKQLKAQIDSIGDAIEVEDDVDIDEAALARARKSRRRGRRSQAETGAGGAGAASGAGAAGSAAGGGAEDPGPEGGGGGGGGGLKEEALRAAMGDVEGADKLGDDLGDDATLSDGASTMADGPDDREAEEDSDCLVCSEGLEGRDTMHVPGFGTCHVECVTCSECSRNLSVEGDPRASDFDLRTGGAAMSLDGKLLCRPHFLDQFKNGVCAGCLVPFRKGERVVEAAGRRWHPQHLVCESCNGPFLDGKCYGVSGLPYCSTCHTDLFLRCTGCGETVKDTEDGITALGKTWHRQCFTCTDCGSDFGGGKFYSRDGKPYCEEHYFENFAPKCAKCTRPVVADGLRACGAVWHNSCFGCSVCSCSFEDGRFMEKDGVPFCEEHYLDRFGQRCGGCGLVIKDKYLQALDQSWHPDCFVCAECGTGFDGGAFFSREGRPYCRGDFARLFCPTCPGCKEPVVDGATVKLGDDKWHAGCLKCNECDKPLEGQFVTLPDPPRRFHNQCFKCDDCGVLMVDDEGKCRYAMREGRKLCSKCLALASGKPCKGCGAVIPADVPCITALGGSWHPACLKCLSCDKEVSGKLLAVAGRPLCGDCFEGSKPMCAACAKTVDGPHKLVLGRPYHNDCLRCTVGGCSLDGGAVKRAEWPVCREHMADEPWPKETADRIAAWEAWEAARTDILAAIQTAKAAEAAAAAADGSQAASAGAAAPAPPAAPPAPAPAPAAAKPASKPQARPAAPAPAAPAAPPQSTTPAPAAPAPPAAPSPATAKPDVNDQFEAFRDEEGDLFFVNKTTGESQWTAPEGFDMSRVPPAAEEPIDESDPNSLWRAYADEEGDLYYVNRKTNETLWEAPAGFTRPAENA
ncbi:hypothetical protein FNF29_05132 [Cafeteria roenbergensis]|uniref:Uncharacterized protein n=1 Tax=Cafeteria roenbergensis TaxID=33653 RepID=A0A5A8CD72_CAFRO|nr:hypothetical protein FNF29_05132 [Cafeteria roenbergensis]|eukprot:KAA0150557.1 hypothetical protein FNF29_05132 [Cafeteria roenbergensis]